MRVRLAFISEFTLGAAVALAAAFSADVSAQQPPGAGARGQSPAREASTQRPAPARTDARDANADLSITARVTADSLRFENVPNARVDFTGKPERETVWEAERENLPPQVQPGVTYRDVGITLRITSVFADIDRIVAEALGEVPPSDDARPSPATPPTPARPATDSPAPAAPTTPPPDAAAAAPRRAPARKGKVN